MQNTTRDLERLQSEFQACRQLLTALGDETRQYLLYTMLSGPCGGSRVVEIAQRTNLSRASISHHIQILKDAGIVQARKEGTQIYYYLAPQDHSIQPMITLFSDIQHLMEQAPDRSEPDEPPL